MEFAARDLRLVSIVCGSGFKSLLSWLDWGHVVPSATKLTKLVQAKIREGVANLKSLLSKQVGVALTTDLWTSRCTEGYMTVTSHFIDACWNLQSGLSSISHFGERHTTVNLARRLAVELECVGTKSKVSATVHDQAANVKHSSTKAHGETKVSLTMTLIRTRTRT